MKDLIVCLTNTKTIELISITCGQRSLYTLSRINLSNFILSVLPPRSSSFHTSLNALTQTLIIFGKLAQELHIRSPPCFLSMNCKTNRNSRVYES